MNSTSTSDALETIRTQHSEKSSAVVLALNQFAVKQEVLLAAYALMQLKGSNITSAHKLFVSTQESVLATESLLHTLQSALVAAQAATPVHTLILADLRKYFEVTG